VIIQPKVSSDFKAAYRRPYTLPRGGEVLIQEAAREDVDRLRAMFARCSAGTIHSRFHLPYATVPEPLIELLVGANGRDGRAFIAVRGGEVVGHAMYAREDDDRTAEVAVVVEDEWQGSGLGRLLLSVTAGEARRAGVETFTCSTLWENRRVLDLARRAFSGVRASHAGGALSIRLPLRPNGT
jgi:GNAT superfamily N-acetyltransferase